MFHCRDPKSLVLRHSHSKSSTPRPKGCLRLHRHRRGCSRQGWGPRKSKVHFGFDWNGKSHEREDGEGDQPATKHYLLELLLSIPMKTGTHAFTAMSTASISRRIQQRGNCNSCATRKTTTTAAAAAAPAPASTATATDTAAAPAAASTAATATTTATTRASVGLLWGRVRL